jgi:uncharacterized protein (TIGR02594 family)
MYAQPWLNTASALLGTREIPGPRNNEEIMRWARVTGLGGEYTADSIPWCGLFVAFCMADNGWMPVNSPLWALNWNKFGFKLYEPALGAIMVFKRNGGGHVGFYLSEDRYNYHILGGNQQDMVSITKVAKDRCVGYRWPQGAEHLLIKGRIYATLNGPISRNEA